jgi:hypothetical protein
MLEWIAYFVGYSLAGMTLKVGDDLLDELDQQSLAWVPLTLSGLLFGLLMTISEWDFILLTSIVIGVLISGKINKIQYIAGFAAIFVVLLLRGIPLIANWPERLILLILLLIAAIFDERGNDWVEGKQTRLVDLFFKYRFGLKFAVLILVVPWPLFLSSAIGLWIFDIGYEIAGWLVRTKYLEEPDKQDYSKYP